MAGLGTSYALVWILYGVTAGHATEMDSGLRYRSAAECARAAADTLATVADLDPGEMKFVACIDEAALAAAMRRNVR